MSNWRHENQPIRTSVGASAPGCWSVMLTVEVGERHFPKDEWTYVERDHGAQFRGLDGTTVVFPWPAVASLTFNPSPKVGA